LLAENLNSKELDLGAKFNENQILVRLNSLEQDVEQSPLNFSGK